MLPLDKQRAEEKLVDEARAKWQVTIERPMGISFKSRRREETMGEAQIAALREFYALHPEAASEHVVLYCKVVS